MIVGIVQSIFTPIARDEAYYWMFGKHLDWGFFDHPPMVGLMTYLGGLMFPGELGVRLLTIIMSLVMFYCIWLMIPEPDRKKNNAIVVFAVLIFANPLFNIYSFITTPDMPLLFFSALYLLFFQRFLDKSNFTNALILGVLMAGLIYSKYHGILVIGFSVLSSLSLFKSRNFYIACITGILLYLPHLFWQYQHDFVSFEYHLFYRSRYFSWNNFMTYLFNMLAVLNPFMLPLFLVSFIKRDESQSRLMNFMFWGFIGFFAFTSLRGHVEPHWIAVAAIPMTLYLHHLVLKHDKYWKYFKITGITSLILIFILRLVLILPLPIKSEFHTHRQSFYQNIQDMAQGREVFFNNSYTEASKYSFYTGDPSFSYNFISFRKNQYDLFESRDAAIQPNVMFVLFGNQGGAKHEVLNEHEDYYYINFDKFPLVNKLKIEMIECPEIANEGDEVKAKMIIHNPHDFDIDLRNPDEKLYWEIYFFEMKERIKGVPMAGVPIEYLSANSSQTFEITFKVDIHPGVYTIGAGLQPKGLTAISVSKRSYPLTVN